MVEGEAHQSSAKGLPVVAKAYHLRVTSQSHPDANRRHMGEASVIAHVLDHLAARRYDQAADVLAQRYTSLDAMMGGLSWDRARFLELTSEEDHTLVGQHERALMANEAAQSARIGDGHAQQHHQGWFQKGKGNHYHQDRPLKGKGAHKTNPFADQATDGQKPEGPGPKAYGGGEQKGGRQNQKGKGKKQSSW